MRKWHRWLSVFFAIFLLFIAATGLLSHFAALWPASGAGPAIAPEAQAHEGEDHPASPVPVASAPAGFRCPEGWTCTPVGAAATEAGPGPMAAGPSAGGPPRGAPGGAHSWVGFFHHLHSGETFGPIGTAISILSGCALLFFSFSGLWLYIRMWRQRAARGARDRWFWK